MGEQHGFQRALWGFDPEEADRLLAEQAQQFERERQALEQAIAIADSQVERLAAECEALAEQMAQAEQRIALIGENLSRQREIAPAQAIALQRQLASLEREHAIRLEEVRRTEARLQAEISERRRSLDQWAMELLRSVAQRGST